MNDKVKITPEQLDAILRYKKSGLDLKNYLDHKCFWIDSFSSLKDLKIDDFARLLYEPNSYVVEPQYIVGELVKVSIRTTEKNADMFGDITKVTDDWIWVNWEEEGSPSGVPRSCVKEVTLEEAKEYRERQSWKSIGREVGEFKEGDSIRTKHMIKPYIVKSNQDISEAKNDYQNNHIRGFYPAESYIKF